MGTRRFVYNRVLEASNKDGEKINKFKLRDKFITHKSRDGVINPNIHEWEVSTPKDIRNGAIRDICKSYKTAFTQLKNGTLKHFKLRFCSKKDAPSIEIDKSSITPVKGGIYIYKKILQTKIKCKKKLKPDYNCRLQVYNNKWYLCVPMKIKETIVSKTGKYCSLDPGVRKFQTLYSEDKVMMFSTNRDRIKKLRDRIDKYRSLRDRKIIKTKRFTRSHRRMMNKITNIISELHNQTANTITREYSYIMLPIFESQEMVRKNKITRINRDIIQYQHYKFQQKIIHKATSRGGKVDICTEEYTSKTCGLCGTINNIGSTEQYICSECNNILDRDINGARNIMIKRIKELGW